MLSSPAMELQCYTSIDDISLTDWRSHLGTDTPFTRYEFHQCLERSGCVGQQTGWLPLHIRLFDADQGIALIPGYLKQHSWGEYVFDFAWAQAHKHYQLPYYPKLVAAVPFTPCAGPRILITSDIALNQVLETLHQSLPTLAKKVGFHSWHWLFAQEKDWESVDSTPWHARSGCQFHWRNLGYAGFTDFLATLTSRKRKSLRKERHKICQQSIDFQWLEGNQINACELDSFYACYANTYLVRGRRPYLNIEFFTRIQKAMPEQILLVKALRDGKPIAYAWNFKHQNTLYGRYWGCHEDIPLLHFETCYYQGMDYCMAHNLEYFDAGAQGEHKLARGFEPMPTRSFHWLQASGFDPAISRFCDQENQHIDAYIDWAKLQAPYKDVD